MPEPTSTTTAAAVAGGLITVAGIATGLPADLILPSFVGALWALRQAPEGGAWSRVLQVLTGTLLACWSATPLSLVAGQVMPEAASVPSQMLRYPLAFVMGWGGLSILLQKVSAAMGGNGK